MTGRGSAHRPIPQGVPSLLSLLAALVAILFVTSAIPMPRPMQTLPLVPPDRPAIPPPTPPGGDAVPPSPPWDPLVDPAPDPAVWSGWDAYVRGPDYVDNVSVPLEGAHFLDNVTAAFPWTEEAWSLLRRNGFVVFNDPTEPDMESAFLYYWHRDLPVFITTDTILHVHHLLFDQMLQDLENESLLRTLENMSVTMLGQASWLRYMLPESLRGPATEAVVFFAVPNLLLGTGADIPADAEAKARGIVGKITEAKGAEFAHIRDGVEEFIDWTQYAPRGHYDRSESLRRFFRTMMWLGRAAYDVENATDLVPASIIAATGLGSPRGEGLWTRIYNATARLVGESDSLNQYDLLRAFLRVFGRFDVALLANPKNVELLRSELSSDDYYRQRILSTILVQDGAPANGSMITFPKIFQFMGQRYVFDSEIMQNVIYDRVPAIGVPRRGLPNGLDVMAALGSGRAAQLLRPELDRYRYETQLRQMWSAASNKSDAFWNRTSYARHLGSLRAVLGTPPQGAPAFARTRAWATEKANTGLGSWSELRHDTILYAKQPYSPVASCSTPGGWVEPYPLFFRRMAWLADQIGWVLETHFDNSTAPVPRFLRVWAQFASINNRLADIAQSELDGRSLSPEDIAFIRSIFVSSASDYTGRITNFGWLPQIMRNATITEKTRDPRIVADVATDPDPETGGVLHVAVGRFRHIVVAYETPEGEWHLAVGPVYRYFEFIERGLTRLTDDQWKTMLDADAPAPPPWVSEFLAA